jgi:hypothetical protein
VTAAQTAATNSSNSAAASATSATNSSNSATASANTLVSFLSQYLGVLASDPTPASLGHPISPNAFYIRSGDGRLRWVVSVNGSGIPTFADASVLPSSTTPGLFTLTGTGLNAGVKLLNTTGNQDIRLIQKDDGYFYITNETTGQVLFMINGTELRSGTSNKIWHSGNDGAGSGADTDLFRGQDDSVFLKKSEIVYGSNANGYWRYHPVSDGKWLLKQYGQHDAGEPTSGPFNFPKTFDVPTTDAIDFQATCMTGNSGSTSGNNTGGYVTSISQFTLFSDDGTKSMRWSAEAIVDSIT